MHGGAAPTAGRKVTGRARPALQPLDMMLAYKAIALHPGLTADQKRVAVAIVDSFNRQSGQCDPSVKRIADLLGISRATVFRTLTVLHGAAIILRESYGGQSHRNAYRPNWEGFRQADVAWRERFDRRAQQSHPCDGGPSQPCDSDGLSAATQTIRTNQKKITTSPTEQVERRRKDPPRPRPDDGPRGADDGNMPDGQGYFIHAVLGGKAETREDQTHPPPVKRELSPTAKAAWGAARQRNTNAIQLCDRAEREFLWGAMTLDIEKAAATAEMRVPDDGRTGLAFIRAAVMDLAPHAGERSGAAG